MQLDHRFYKRNAGFCVRFLYSSLPSRPQWELPPLTAEQEQWLQTVLSQNFTYFAKGTHACAFVSDDQKYVIKFHRFPSHMRLFPWLNRPFSYRFDKKRMKIKEHNLTRYTYIMDNYKSSLEDLKEETGVLLLHINQTNHLKKSVSLIDKTGNRYEVPLDKVTFILQERADLIFPTLDNYLARGEVQKIKESISQIFQLITRCSQKGYINNDPVLTRNYGLLSDKAIHIDIGDLIKQEAIDKPENYIPIMREITQPLRTWILQKCPTLLDHFEQELSLSRS